MKEYNEHLRDLGILPAHVYPRVSDGNAGDHPSWSRA